MLAIDCGEEVVAGRKVQVFCAVLPWSRFRFVRFAADQRQATTLGMLAECFEVLGGVPKTVLADRVGCLKGGVVADVVVLSPVRQAAFPVAKRLEEFDVPASSIPPSTFDYLASLEWIRAAENVCLIGPAGTGKSHTLIALRIAAVEAGLRARYCTAAEFVETLYRGLADNSVGKVIENLLRNELVIVDELGFAPLDDTGAATAVPARHGRLRT